MFASKKSAQIGRKGGILGNAHSSTSRSDSLKKEPKPSPSHAKQPLKSASKSPFEGSFHDGRIRSFRVHSNDKDDLDLSSDLLSLQDRSVVDVSATHPKVKELVMHQQRSSRQHSDHHKEIGHVHDGDISADTEVESYGNNYAIHGVPHDGEDSDKTSNAAYMNAPRAGLYMHSIPEHGHGQHGQYSRSSSLHDNKTPSPANTYASLGNRFNTVTPPMLPNCESLPDEELERLSLLVSQEKARRAARSFMASVNGSSASIPHVASNSSLNNSSIANYPHLQQPLKPESPSAELVDKAATAPSTAKSSTTTSAAANNANARDPRKKRSHSGGPEYAHHAAIAAMNAALLKKAPAVPTYKQFAGALPADGTPLPGHEPEDIEVKNAFVAEQPVHAHSNVAHVLRAASGALHPHEKMFQYPRNSDSAISSSTPNATPAAYSSSPHASPHLGSFDTAEVSVHRPPSRSNMVISTNTVSSTPLDDVYNVPSSSRNKSATSTPKHDRDSSSAHKMKKLESALRESKQYETTLEGSQPISIEKAGTPTEHFTPLHASTAPKVSTHIGSFPHMSVAMEALMKGEEAVKIVKPAKMVRNVSISSDISSSSEAVFNVEYGSASYASASNLTRSLANSNQQGGAFAPDEESSIVSATTPPGASKGGSQLDKMIRENRLLSASPSSAFDDMVSLGSTSIQSGLSSVKNSKFQPTSPAARHKHFGDKHHASSHKAAAQHLMSHTASSAAAVKAKAK